MKTSYFNNVALANYQADNVVSIARWPPAGLVAHWIEDALDIKVPEM